MSKYNCEKCRHNSISFIVEIYISDTVIINQFVPVDKIAWF